MTAVAWGVVVALIVGVGNLVLAGFALRLSLDNRRHARAEPTRQRQQELRDQLRIVVEGARKEIVGVENLLTRGAVVPDEVPLEIRTALQVVEPLIKRLSDDRAGHQFSMVGFRVYFVGNHWEDLARAQPSDDEREGKQRRINAAETELRKSIDEAKPLLDARIAYLDAHDKGA